MRPTEIKRILRLCVKELVVLKYGMASRESFPKRILKGEMMKKVFMLMLCSLFIGCGDSVVHIPKTPDHGDRLNEIDLRLQVLEVVTRELKDGVAANKQEIIDKTNLFTQELNDLKSALESQTFQSVKFIELCASSGEFGIEQGGSIYAVGMGYDGSVSLVKLTNGTYYTTSNLANACRFSLGENGLKTLDSGHDIRHLFPHLNGNNSGGVIPTIKNQFRIDEYTNHNNNNNLTNTYIVTNVGMVSWSISPTDHGFTVNNNANDLGKGSCNVNSILDIPINKTEIFENCEVTRLL